MTSARALDSSIFTFHVGSGEATKSYQVPHGVLAGISEPMKTMTTTAGMKESVKKVVEMKEVGPELCMLDYVSRGLR
jgi:hypothetical protein